MAFAALKERAQRLNERLAGHRFLFDTVAPRREHAARSRRPTRSRPATSCGRSSEEERACGASCGSPHRVQDRLADVGALTQRGRAQPRGGRPVARAPRACARTRAAKARDCSTASFAPAARRNSHAATSRARLDVRQVELEQTFAILDELLSGTVAAGRRKPRWRPRRAASASRGSRALAARPSASSSTTADTIKRLHLRTGSYANWPVLAHAARENLLPDFPLINKSFELCYACADR